LLRHAGIVRADSEIFGQTILKSADVLEDAVPLLQGQIVAEGGDVILVGPLRRREPDYDQPIGIAVRQGTEKNRMNHAEDQGVGADAQRDRERHDGCEAGISDEQAACVAEIVPQGAIEEV